MLSTVAQDPEGQGAVAGAERGEALTTGGALETSSGGAGEARVPVRFISVWQSRHGDAILGLTPSVDVHAGLRRARNLISTRSRCGRSARRRQFVAGLDAGTSPSGPSFLLVRNISVSGPGEGGTGSGRTRKNRRSLRDRSADQRRRGSPALRTRGLGFLAPHAQIRELDCNDLLVDESTKPSEVFLTLEGTVAIEMRRELDEDDDAGVHAAVEKGLFRDTVTLAVLPAPVLVGEFASIDGFGRKPVLQGHGVRVIRPCWRQ